MSMTPDAERVFSTLLVNRLLDEQLLHSCLNCEHYVENGQQGECLLARQTPPPRVIVYGCEHWSFCPF